MTTNRLFVVVSRFPVFLDQKSYKAQNKLENRMTNECFELEGYDIKTNVKKTKPDFQRERCKDSQRVTLTTIVLPKIDTHIF